MAFPDRIERTVEAMMKVEPQNAALPAAGGTDVPALPALPALPAVVTRAMPAATAADPAAGPAVAPAVTPAVTLTGTLGLAAACWVIAVWQMNGMDMGTATQLGSFGAFIAVWVAMMAAMMLPGAAPAMLRHGAHARGVRAVPLFAGSYLAVWALAGVAVFAADRPHGTLAAGTVVIAAAVYEVAPLKRHFRRRCRDSTGSGFKFGLYCAGSSAGLMLMLVALGVMSITWMAVIAVLVLAQKLLPAKTAIDLPLALAIAGLGVLIVITPSLVPGLSPPM
jgi:predicted metal-binding membrane protein